MLYLRVGVASDIKNRDTNESGKMGQFGQRSESPCLAWHESTKPEIRRVLDKPVILVRFHVLTLDELVGADVIGKAMSRPLVSLMIDHLQSRGRQYQARPAEAIHIPEVIHKLTPGVPLLFVIVHYRLQVITGGISREITRR